MSICHLYGLSSTSPFTKWRSLSLSHPDVAHTLELTAFQGAEGYRSTLTGWTVSNGRSQAGSLRIQGYRFPPPYKASVSAIVSGLQGELFRQFLAAQELGTDPITLSDRIGKLVHIAGVMTTPTWLSGSPSTNEAGQTVGYAAFNVLLDVDEAYLSQAGSDRFLLQFTAIQS